MFQTSEEASQAAVPRGLILAIDTSGPACSAAVLDAAAGSFLSVREPEIGMGHAERLMGEIEAALGEAGAGYGHLSAVAVCVGPGSFTGLRVGIAAARGLALSLSIPALGVTSLAAMAEPAMAPGQPLLVVRDARRGQLFAAAFLGGEALGEPVALAPSGVPDFSRRFPEKTELSILGGGAEVAAAALSDRPTRILGTSDSVDIRALARRAAGGTVRPPAPLYLRDADAKPQLASGLLRNPPSSS